MVAWRNLSCKNVVCMHFYFRSGFTNVQNGKRKFIEHISTTGREIVILLILYDISVVVVICFCGYSAATAAYNGTESRCCQPVSGKCIENILEYTSSKRRATCAGRKLIRHVKGIKLTARTIKIIIYSNRFGINPSNRFSLTNSQQRKGSNPIVNRSSSEFRSKYITVMLRPCIKLVRALLSNSNFPNLHVIDSVYDDQKVEVHISECCLNV